MCTNGSNIIVDTTLRDGGQMPGICLTLKDKLRIVSSLRSAGITQIEAGFAASSDLELQQLRSIVQTFPSMNVSVWARAKKSDILAAYKTGASVVHISFPASRRHASIVSMDSRKILQLQRELVRFAKGYFPIVTIGAQDATRASKEFLEDFLRCAADSGASRVRIADTVGVATPDSISDLISFLNKKRTGIAMEFHGHNDFGMATANALAAIKSGAEAVSVTVNGVGERAGNAALEQVAAALLILHGTSCNVRLDTLPEVCCTVAKVFRFRLPPQQPLVGDNAFTHESGIHCHGMLRDHLSYQPCEAEVLGRKERYIIGSSSGKSTVQAYCKSRGMSISGQFASDLVHKLKASGGVTDENHFD